MSGKSGLTAWERWELASFDSTESGSSTTVRAARGETAVPPAPTSLTPPGPTPAEQELAALRKSTYDEAFASGRHDGYADGHKEGFATGQSAGEAAGREVAERHGREQVERLIDLTRALDEQIAGLDAGVANDLLDLALEVARKVVGHTLAVRPEAVVEVIHEALAQLPVQHAAIHLNPEDASLARLYAGDALAHAGHRIHENAKLGRGDVVIECGGSQVDATVATRWRRVVETIGRAHEGKLGHAAAELEALTSEAEVEAVSPGTTKTAATDVVTEVAAAEHSVASDVEPDSEPDAEPDVEPGEEATDESVVTPAVAPAATDADPAASKPDAP